MKKLALVAVLTLVTSVGAFTVKRNSASPTEDCIQYDPYSLQIEDIGEKGWRLTSSGGNMWMQILDNREDAEAALILAQQHNYQCFIGRNNRRPDRARYIAEYWK